MYDDNNSGSSDLPDLGPEPSSRSGLSGLTHKIFSNAETIIPIVLIVIFLLFFAVSILDVDTKGIPVVGPLIGDLLGDDRPDILIIGNPEFRTSGSPDSLFARDDFTQKFNFYGPYPSSDFDYGVLKRIDRYDMIILDQSNSYDKKLPNALAEALRTYLRSGDLIIIGNSGTEIDKDAGLMGFGLTLEEFAPVECQRKSGIGNSCENPTRVVGYLQNMDPDGSNPLKGIHRFPEVDASTLEFTTYDVIPLGEEWMSLRSDYGNFPAIVELSSNLGFGGKVIYFNYHNIADTPTIIRKTLDYLS